MNNNIKWPKVSVIIPTWNRADLIESAIQSVLDQTFTEFELIILDDASTDNTEELVKIFLTDQRIRYIKHSQNLGITKNRNYGLGVINGEYVAMLDSDDIWISKDKLKKQVEFLDSHPQHGVIGTYTKIIDNDNKKNAFISWASLLFLGTNNFLITEFFLIRNQIFHSSVMFKKKAVDELGNYDENMPIWEDYELWLRLGLKYKFANIPEFLTGYRVHQKNITNLDKQKGLDATLLILKKYKNEYPNYYLGYLKYFLKKNISSL